MNKGKKAPSKAVTASPAELSDSDLETVSGGADNIGSQSTGAGAGKVTFNPFQITKQTDKSSP